MTLRRLTPFFLSPECTEGASPLAPHLAASPEALEHSRVLWGAGMAGGANAGVGDAGDGDLSCTPSHTEAGMWWEGLVGGGSAHPAQER